MQNRTTMKSRHWQLLLGFNRDEDDRNPIVLLMQMEMSAVSGWVCGAIAQTLFVMAAFHVR